jgi:hypothetical protein
VPETETLNVALPPSIAEAADGWDVIAGTEVEAAALTVRNAPLLVAEPALLETTTE